MYNPVEDSVHECVPMSRGVQLIEVAIFLLLIVPSMVLSLFALSKGKAAFSLIAYSTTIRDIALVGLILFFVWRNGERMGQIGWSLKNVWRDIILGILLFIPFTLLSGVMEKFFRALGLSAASRSGDDFLIPKTTYDYILASVMVVVVALAEETMFRGYLILRFSSITRSLFLAIILSSTIFALGHGYEGESGMATVGFMGLIFALVYVWRRSLTAPIVMHFLQDFTAIILIPLTHLYMR